MSPESKNTRTALLYQHVKSVIIDTLGPILFKGTNRIKVMQDYALKMYFRIFVDLKFKYLKSNRDITRRSNFLWHFVFYSVQVIVYSA